MEVREIKKTLDGREQVFTTEGLLLSPRLAVVRFWFPEERRVSGLVLPQGGYTLGYFWAYRHYLLYRFCGPDGALIAHRFDIIDRVRLRPDHVEYRDLALDIWVRPAGETLVEDEEEVAAYAASGRLTPDELALIERTKQLLLTRHHRITAEAAAITSSLLSPSAPSSRHCR